MKEQNVVMYESDEAASIQTVTGWVDRTGRFWGKDEHMARYAGSTHRICQKNHDHGSHATNGYCEKCYSESRQKYFASLERKAWAGEPLVIFDNDNYFFDSESLADYCWENCLLPSELQLLICESNYPREIDMNDHCEEIIPDGGDHHDITEAIWQAAEALNKAIRESSPISWSGGKFAAIISDDLLTDEQKAEIFAERASAGKDGE
ncbi:hypothetical protein [Pantoea sp. JV6]|uniref:hypothetical protein n=1 Tax=Pantoea sp. JV6 TaxID=2981604 RepID=UPI00221F4986|nr:hypothetical protein [Pantoea sp. JV6]MCW0974404.1 hypothetical protein [Pantoea sp. JV6]